ncbi:hypothetical protein [Geobacillus thermoleovorans]|nr:hypothetical protein [Geobacillus thermoleovorans]
MDRFVPDEELKRASKMGRTKTSSTQANTTTATICAPRRKSGSAADG